MRTEFYTDQEIAALSLRGWKNLNAIAQVLSENHATSAATQMSISGVARRTGMDIAQTSRLIKGKPGIVRMMRQVGNRKPITTGIYLLPEVKELASPNYYPAGYGAFGTLLIRKGSGYRIPKQIVTETSDKNPKPVGYDVRLASLLSAPPEDYVSVPFLKQTGDVKLHVIKTWLLNSLPDTGSLPTEWTIDSLPVGDLKKLQEQYGNLAIRATSVYALINETIENKELK